MSEGIPQPHGGKLTPWKPGESGNPKGRPKKTVSALLSRLKKEGYESVGTAEVMELMEYMLGLDQDSLYAIANNKEETVISRIVAKEILLRQDFTTIERVIDRAHGKQQRGQLGGFAVVPITVVKPEDVD